MALIKVICWAIIFIARIRFPPGKSLATMFDNNYFITLIFLHYILGAPFSLGPGANCSFCPPPPLNGPGRYLVGR